MSSIEELLAIGSELTPFCIIDQYTREISLPTEYNLFGVESDEDVKRIWFRCPKVVENNVDLSTFNIYINYRNANGDGNSYLVTDVTDDEDDIVFSWLLSRQVNLYAGNINFIVCAKKSDSNGIVKEWNTKIATSIVAEGLETTAEIVERSSDIIEQILLRLDTTDSETSESISKLENKQSELDKSIKNIASDLSKHVEQDISDKNQIDKNLNYISEQCSNNKRNIDSIKTDLENLTNQYNENKESVSSNIEAINANVSDMETIQTKHSGDIKQIYDEITLLKHKHATITSFSVKPNVCELGSTVNDITVQFSVSKKPTKLEATINNKIYQLPLDDISDDITSDIGFGLPVGSGLNLTDTASISLTATDDLGHTSTKTAAINFYPQVYYGCGTNWPANPKYNIQPNRKMTFTVTSSESEYIWYACPVSYGIPTFYVGGFEGGFTDPETVTINNRQYYRSHSVQTGLGKTTVEVR